MLGTVANTGQYIADSSMVGTVANTDQYISSSIMGTMDNIDQYIASSSREQWTILASIYLAPGWKQWKYWPV